MSQSIQDPEKTGFNCAGCHQPDDDESEKIFCDHCQRWYHFGCAGVSADARDVSWSCEECLRLSADKEGPPDLEEELEMLEQQMVKERQAIELETIIHKRKLEHQRSLFLLRQQAEKEKREMELAYEQERLELLVAEEEAYQKKRGKVLKHVQEKLEKVERESARMELLAKNIDEGKFGWSSRRKEYGKKITSIKSTMEKLHEKKSERCKSVRKTIGPVKVPHDGDNERNMNHNNKKKKKKKKKQQNVYCEDKYQDSTNTSSEENEEDFEESEDESSSQGEDSGKPENSVMRSKSTTRRPTKAQLSARQFLSKKLPTFNGRHEEWPLFISAYETSTAACGFSNVENLARLQECLKGQALETVRSRLLLPSAVPQIVETLRMLYGRPEQLLNMLLANVRKAPPPKADKLASYIQYGVVVQELTDHLEATGLTAHLINPMLIQELTEKLPANMQLEWVRYRRKTQNVTLRTLSKFLSRLVKDASEITSYSQVASSESDEEFLNLGRKEQEEFREGFLHTHITEENIVGNQQSYRNRTACRICGRFDHRVRNCRVFKRLSLTERWEAVRKWKLCYLCLNAHGGFPCKLNFRCNVDQCNEDHNTLLHIGYTHRTDCKQSVIFRTIPVTLRSGDRAVDTIAFLDEGSSHTLVEKSLANILEAKGVMQQLRVTWTAGMTRWENDSRRLELWISAIGSSQRFRIGAAHTVDSLKLPQQTATMHEVSHKYSHLRELQGTEFKQGVPQILIGLKDIHLCAPLESIIGKPNEPIAVRSKLGWSVYGPSCTCV